MVARNPTLLPTSAFGFQHHPLCLQHFLFGQLLLFHCHVCSWYESCLEALLQLTSYKSEIHSCTTLKPPCIYLALCILNLTPQENIFTSITSNLQSEGISWCCMQTIYLLLCQRHPQHQQSFKKGMGHFRGQDLWSLGLHLSHKVTRPTSQLTQVCALDTLFSDSHVKRAVIVLVQQQWAVTDKEQGEFHMESFHASSYKVTISSSTFSHYVSFHSMFFCELA